MAPRKVIGSLSGVEIVEAPRNGTKGMCCGAGGARMWMEEDIGPKVNDVRAQELVETGASRIATACPFCYIMMDDGVKAAGKEEDEVKVADLAIHLVEALEAGEDDAEASRKVLLENPNVATPDSIPADDLMKPVPAGDPVPVGAVQRVVAEKGSTGAVRSQTVISDSPVEPPEGDQLEDDTVSEELEDTGKPDNLSLIRGLDPYSAQRLNERGITRFVQVARLTDAEIAAIEEDFDLPGCFNRFSWRYQADQLAQEE